MDAELGNNPSYVWRSLLAARDIIIEGSKWKVVLEYVCVSNT